MRLAALLLGTLLLLPACDPYAPYQRAVERDFKPRSCEPNSVLPWERRKVRGLEVVALCGSDTHDALDVLKGAGIKVSSIVGYLPGPGASDDDDGRAFIRYTLCKRPPPGPSTYEGLPYDAVIVWDRKMETRLIGLIPREAPDWQMKGWARDKIDYYSRVGGHLLEEYEQKQEHALVLYELSSLIDSDGRARYSTPAWERFSPLTCAAARFDTRSGYADSLNEEARRAIVESIFGKEESDDSRAMLALLADPEARCGPEYERRLKEGLAQAQKKKQAKDAEAARLAAIEKERERQRTEEAAREREARELVEEGRLREQAERLALGGRPFAALAVLGWMAAVHGNELPLLAPPSRKVALRAGLSDSDLLEALRGELFRRYFATLEFTGAGQLTVAYPRASGDRAPHTVSVVIDLPERIAVAVESSRKSLTESNGGSSIADRAAEQRASARIDSLSREARPLVERVQAIDARLARIEELLAGPRLEIRAGAKQGEVSRMERVCQPVPGGPPKCENKWVTFSREGPMRSNGGLAPWEADDLTAERKKLSAERAQLASRLKELGAQAESAAASAPKTRPQPPPRTLEYDVYHYHAEGQARVRVTLDGKRWPEITVPWTYDDKSTRIAYSAATLESYARQAALNTAKAEVDGRWHQHVAERLGEHLAAIRDEEARSREGSLGWYYLDDTSPRRFLEHSIDALRASGVVVECWLRDSGCFSAPPPAR